LCLGSVGHWKNHRRESALALGAEIQESDLVGFDCANESDPPRTATYFPIKLKSRTVFLASITGIFTGIADSAIAAASMTYVDMDFLNPSFARISKK
jgi:hypothetical protein